MVWAAFFIASQETFCHTTYLQLPKRVEPLMLTRFEPLAQPHKTGLKTTRVEPVLVTRIEPVQTTRIELLLLLCSNLVTVMVQKNNICVDKKLHLWYNGIKERRKSFLIVMDGIW